MILVVCHSMYSTSLDDVCDSQEEHLLPKYITNHNIDYTDKVAFVK
jgi:hypothetical protein